MSNVSRSVYQKLKEENKRLLADIRTLTMDSVSMQAVLVHRNWKNRFTQDKEFSEMLKKFAQKYMKEHPEEFPWLNKQ